MHGRDFLPFFVADAGSTLRRQLRRRPELWGMAVTPFMCADWGVRERIALLVEHCRCLDGLPEALAQSMDQDVELIRLDELGRPYRLVLHQVSWMLREGPLTLSLFDDDERLFSLSFSVVRERAQLVAYVGGLQGRRSADALDWYRDLTKSAFGLRPRDLLFELFCAFARCLGVARIKAVSDGRHSLNSDYARRNSPESTDAPRLSYDEVWRERGGVRVSAAFFEVPLTPRRRSTAEIPAKKRKMYAARYSLLAIWETRIAARLGAAPGGWLPTERRPVATPQVAASFARASEREQVNA
jgi:uncharacterized protein VirK/YbjX